MKKSFALVLALAMSLTGASALAAEKVTAVSYTHLTLPTN